MVPRLDRSLSLDVGRLRALCLRECLSQAALARAAGVSLTPIHAAMDGKRISRASARKLAKALRVPISELLEMDSNSDGSVEKNPTARAATG